MKHTEISTQLIEKIYELFLHSHGITTDSRKPAAGSIFFALKGEHFDANAFVAGALEAGCSYAIIDNPAFAQEGRTICVPDTLATLQALARHHRRNFSIPFLAITGTNGKTTTKELTAAVLKQQFKVHATQGNLNNHIGVPLTLLSMAPDTEIAIIEMGANHPGEIAELCSIAEPTHGLITGIGKAHLEGFGSVEGIMRTKGELYDWLLAHKGTPFCNTSDFRLREMAMERFGTLDQCQCYGPEKDGISILAPNSHAPNLSFMLKDGTTIHTQLAGDYNAHNVLAALAVGRHFGIDTQTCIRGIESYTPGNNRSQITPTERNILLVDAYNANPTSMQAALKSFASWTDPHKAVILGDMFELGEASKEEHRGIIRLLSEIRPECIWIVGKEFESALEGMQTPEHLRHFGSTADCAEFLKEHPLEGMTILVKGSRGMKLETLIEHL